MQDISSEEYKRILLAELVWFDGFCREHNFRYSLYAGTLLGCIRESGFIPWDDDVDVFMLREDFAKMESFFRHNNTGFYRLASLNNSRNFSAPLAKLIDKRTLLSQTLLWEKEPLGAYIDVFVFDRIPHDEKENTRLFSKTNKIERLWSSFSVKPVPETGFLKKAIKNIGHQFNLARFFAREMQKNAIRNSKCSSSFFTNLMYNGVPNRVALEIDGRVFDHLVERNFEGHSMMVIPNYDSYLRSLYGDYTVRPPVNEQKTHHDFVVSLRL